MVRIGDLIVFTSTTDPNLRLQPGTQGKVISIETITARQVITILLDNGSKVKLIEGFDQYEVISEPWLTTIIRQIKATS